MAYYDRHGELGDPGEARRICGAPTTTLDQWRQRLRREPRAVTAGA